MNFLKKGLLAGGFYLSFCTGGFVTGVLGDLALISAYEQTDSERTRAFIGHYRPWYFRHHTMARIFVVHLRFPYDYGKCLWDAYHHQDYKDNPNGMLDPGWKLRYTMDKIAEMDERERARSKKT